MKSNQKTPDFWPGAFPDAHIPLDGHDIIPKTAIALPDERRKGGPVTKKKTILTILLLCVLLAALCLWPDFHMYRPQSKTIPSEEGGIILSITTYDGKTESKPFVKSLGHSWISVDNRSGHSVYLKDYEIQNGEILTFSIWAISGHRGVAYNLEANFARDFGRYEGRQSLSIPIEEAQLKAVGEYIDRNDDWTAGKNCSCWSVRLWNEVVDEAYQLKTQTLVYTPKRLQRSLNEYDCVETNTDYSRAGGIFFYQNGGKTELKLCS